MLKTSDRGIAFIKEKEGFRAMPYRDGAGNWTVGYGFRINEEQAKQLKLTGGMNEHEAESHLRSLIEVIEGELKSTQLSFTLLQHHLDALVSFIYNLGYGYFAESGLYVSLRLGIAQAMSEWLVYDHAGGRVETGLLIRRQQEVRMFIYGIYPA